MVTKDKSASSKQGRKGTILLVGEKFTHLLTKRLLSCRYQVIAVDDGFEALETLRMHHVDLIISRLDLPKMDCLELMMNLRDLNIETPIVILENAEAEQGGTAAAVTNIWGYCYPAPVTSKVTEVLSCIKEPGG